jgi:hypothetical protein
MRQIVLTLTLLSLAFAPAPFPRAERQHREPAEARLVREYDRRLRELGVSWELLTDGGEPRVSFTVARSGSNGLCFVRENGLAGALETILRHAKLGKG